MKFLSSLMRRNQAPLGGRVYKSMGTRPFYVNGVSGKIPRKFTGFQLGKKKGLKQLLVVLEVLLLLLFPSTRLPLYSRVRSSVLSSCSPKFPCQVGDRRNLSGLLCALRVLV